MDVDSLISQWKLYANANKARAQLLRREGDDFGMELCLARGEVRRLAAEILEQFAPDSVAAAKEMHGRAKALWQLNLPIVGFDDAAIKYTKARIWQDCALALDPSLPIVQPKLKEW